MSQNDEALKQLLDVTRWLLFDERPPGMVGRAVALSSRRENPELVRDDRGWVHSGSDPPERVMNTAEILELIATQQLNPRYVHVEPDLADLLFEQAIADAQESVLKLEAAQRHVEELRAEPEHEHSHLMPFVFAGAALDRAVRSSMSAIILAVAAAEAQVNRWAADLGGWHDYEDQDVLPRKCRTLGERRGRALELGRHPLQSLQKTVDLRNDLVHSKPVATLIAATGQRAAIPGTSLSLAARRSCVHVRQSLVLTAQALGIDPPRYLAYCPPGSPDDHGAWRSAVLLTGTREDPDFPPRRRVTPDNDSSA